MMTITDLAPHLDLEAPAPPRILGFDHLEWFVGNARQSAHYWASAFGFHIDAYAGPETGVAERQSYVVSQGRLRFVLTSSLTGTGEIAEFVSRHGDAVRDVAYTVDDAIAAYRSLLARGAIGIAAPRSHSDARGRALRASVAAFGSTRHSLIERRDYHGAFLPGYEPVDLPFTAGQAVGLTHADHVVTNVAQGDLDATIEWYGRVFGFQPLQHFSEDAISTEFSALRSTVVSDGDQIVQPVNEPASGRRKSQIEEFLDYHGEAGVQHVAMHTPDIVAAVTAMRARGVRFMTVPASYYAEAQQRIGAQGADLPWPQLAELGILVDGDDGGTLLQIFTEPVASRPTAFMEIIQRRGAQGFGEGNFKALFTAIEVEQARRGNL